MDGGGTAAGFPQTLLPLQGWGRVGRVERTRDAGKLSWCHPDVPGLWWLCLLSSGCMHVPRKQWARFLCALYIQLWKGNSLIPLNSKSALGKQYTGNGFLPASSQAAYGTRALLFPVWGMFKEGAVLWVG